MSFKNKAGYTVKKIHFHENTSSDIWISFSFLSDVPKIYLLFSSKLAVALGDTIVHDV